MSDIEFPVKEITWSAYEHKTPILLQEKNGPCPLIALVNTLLLKADIKSISTLQENQTSSARVPTIDLRALLQKHAGRRVLLEEVISCLGEILLEIPLVDSKVVQQLLDSLPLLHTGLTVNPNVTTGRFPSQDLAATIFGAFDLDFLHGWIWQPGEVQEEAEEVILRLQTFDALQDYLLTAEGSASMGVSQWLGQNSTQLTPYGLSVMDSEMATDSVAIFFRNNHFSTVYKGPNHEFYLLLTDTAFTKRPRFVWQSMISVLGNDDLFFGGDFVPVDDEQDLDSADLAVVRQLQEKEDAAIAKRLQSDYNSVPKKTHDARRGTADRGARMQKLPEPKEGLGTEKDKKKKKGNCVIA